MQKRSNEIYRQPSKFASEVNKEKRLWLHHLDETEHFIRSLVGIVSFIFEHIVFGLKILTPTVAMTKYYDGTEEPTLPINLGTHSIYFYAE